MAYKLLVVANSESLTPPTAEAIRDFARGGGKVVFVDRAPDRAPGLTDAGAGDRRVKAATEAAIQAGALLLPGPLEGAGSTELRVWTNDVLDRVRFKRELPVASPRDGLYSLHHRATDAELFFFTNTYRRESSRSHVDFALGESGLWRWNPETGERSPYDLRYDATGFEIELGPLESVLLVTGPRIEPAPEAAQAADRPEPRFIATPWKVTFHPIRGKEPFSVTMNKLADFTASDDPRIRKFAGTAVYQTTFTLDRTHFTKLDLGRDNDFISEVELNGHKLGVSWYGAPVFDLHESLRKGENQLTVRYTTTLWNAMDKKELQAAGLMGPVTLRGR